ncbi:MAG: SDR family NAD(P)-dependent oxidoreductase [Balneolaceae bacterium]|nr:SDR family NAD(P)-dependent oxidoreductase [Balneolaceae bacterium]
MVLRNNTILITGGSSGLGLEMARKFSTHNKVLICGRNIDKLKQAQEKIPGIHIFQCDLSEREECRKLAGWVKSNHPECNALINNAAIVHQTNFYEDEQIISKAEDELNTNFLAPLRLIKLLIPVIESNPCPALINITTGLVYAPRALYPIYNSCKAALHSFTQVLRIQLRDHPITVIEVFFPVVDTPWHQGNTPDIAITPNEAVTELIKKLHKGKEEIRIGKVKLLYFLSRLVPRLALKIINKV